MSIYELVLKSLLKESDSIKSLPDELVLSEDFLITDKEGFEYKIIKIGKSKTNGERLYKIKCGDKVKVINYETMKKDYKRT